MHPLFQGMPEVDVFIDDIGVFTTTSFEDHLIIVRQVLKILQDNGFTVNSKIVYHQHPLWSL